MKPAHGIPGPPLVVTAGEPAGIGPDLCLELARRGAARDVVVVSDPSLLRARAAELGMAVAIVEVTADAAGARPGADNELVCVPFEFPVLPPCGRPDPANARTLLDGIAFAVDGCRQGRFAALVTGPLQKSVINDAGIPFTGHTEYLAELTGARLPVMLLAAGDLRVALATTHLPLRDVPQALTHDSLTAVLEVLHDGLVRRFGIPDPVIAVLGLNPHAGEGGHLGSEDAGIIRPVVETLQKRGLRVRGPLPADTAFTPMSGHRDAVLAMYHDQGLPVIKYAGFGHAVNVTLGLPIVRTSVDHGTALDLAGSGRADTGSLLAAIDLARRLTPDAH